MYYDSHYNTRSAGSAPSQLCVSLSQPPIRRRNTLARSIALTLAVGIVALPTMGLAATLKGVKFQNMDANPKFTFGVDKPYVNHQIMIRNQATGEVLSATTGKDGAYIISNIPIGSDYTVNVSFPDGLCLVTAVPPLPLPSSMILMKGK